MSVQMSHAGWQITGLTPTKKIILLLLCNYADENNQCYPSHRHIADKVGLKDTKGVQRTIKEFEELGLLSIEHRKTANGGFTSNRYTLLLPMGANTTRVVKTVSDTVVEPDNTKEDTKTLYTKEFQSLKMNNINNIQQKLGQMLNDQSWLQFCMSYLQTKYAYLTLGDYNKAFKSCSIIVRFG